MNVVRGFPSSPGPKHSYNLVCFLRFPMAKYVSSTKNNSLQNSAYTVQLQDDSPVAMDGKLTSDEAHLAMSTKNPLELTPSLSAKTLIDDPSAITVAYDVKIKLSVAMTTTCVFLLVF